MSNSVPLHLVRFGIHADSDCLETTKDLYDLILFNANMVEYTTEAIGAFITRRLGNKPYIIDPGTHAFAQPPSAIMSSGKETKPENVKLSVQGLAASYGLEMGNPVGNRPLMVDDFDEILPLENFVSNVIDFQINKIADELKDETKYLPKEYQFPPPNALVAPYFYMSLDNFKEWLPINLSMLEIARAIANREQLYAEITVSGDLIHNTSAVDHLVGELAECKAFDGILLWISNFEEHIRTESDLLAMKNFVMRLAELDRPLLNLYGGYYSILLNKFGLSGIAHGPGYGEHRDIIPLGGGPPKIRYYFTPVHQRLDYADIQLLIGMGIWASIHEFEEEVCNGVVCSSILDGNLDNFYNFGETELRRRDDGHYDEVMTKKARNLLKAHYIEAKLKEHQYVAEHELPFLIDQLRSAKKKYERYFGRNPFPHLNLWAECMSLS